MAHARLAISNSAASTHSFSCSMIFFWVGANLYHLHFIILMLTDIFSLMISGSPLHLASDATSGVVCSLNG